MSKIKSILAFVALMLCGGAWADAMPVAVWAGNFETKTQGAFTLDLNGNSESSDHSRITIDQNVGVKVDTTTAVSGITVLFRVENLEVGESVKTLATASSASNAGNDRIGIYLDASGQTHGIWADTSTYDANVSTQSAISSIENTAYMALAYSTGGTSFYINTGSGYKAAHVNARQKADTDTALYGVAVGGTRSHGANFAAASGMVITGIAVFNEKFANTIALSNYQFPDEAQVWLHSKFGSQYSAANEISSSAKVVFPGIKTLEDLQDNYVLSGTINGDWMKDSNFSYTVYPVKIAEEKSNDTLTSLTMQFHGVNDGNMKVASVKFTCTDAGISAQQTGQRYLTPDNNNAATYLFKQEITGGTGVTEGAYTIYSLAAYPKSQLTLPEATAKVISWNVAQGETKVAGKGEQKTLVGNIPESAWTEKAGVNQYTSTDYTDVKVYDVASGETTTDTSIKFRWSVSGATNYGYLKAGDNANDAAIESDYEYMGMWLAKLNKDDTATSFSVSGIPFMSYDVILYYNGNAGFDSYQIRPMTINGSKYNVNRMGELVSVGTAVDGKALWGQRGLSRPELGVNAGIIKNLSAGTLTITDNAKGGGLAAVQIVEHPVRTTNVTISGDDNLVSTLAAEHSFGKDPIIITANGSATLTVDEAWTYGPLILASESGAFTIKGADNLPLDDLDFSRVAESLVFEFDATTTEYTATDKVMAYMATMSDEKVTFLFKGSETSGATVAYTENAPIITGHLVFQGGTHHVFKYNGGNHIFASGASNDHPTILVESDTTLTVYGHDMTGYNATPTSDGIIRVKDRGSLVFENYGASGTTFFYNQRICLDPGAEWTIGKSLTGSDFRMTGGSSVDQIFVPESATDATANPARITVSTGAHLNLAKDGSAQGIGINVGANSKLVFNGDVQSLNNDANVATDDETLAARVIEKKGAGVLEIADGNISAKLQSTDGALKLVGINPAGPIAVGTGKLELAQKGVADYEVTAEISGEGRISCVSGTATISNCGSFTGNLQAEGADSKLVVNSDLTASIYDNGDNSGTIEIPSGKTLTTSTFAGGKKVLVNGTYKFTATSLYDASGKNLSGVVGDGMIWISTTDYFALPQNSSYHWSSDLAVRNDAVKGLIFTNTSSTEIGTLSGVGELRVDWQDGARTAVVKQAEDAEWSGGVYNSHTDRFGKLSVKSANANDIKTLTISGTTNRNGSPTLEVQATGSVKLTGSWSGNVTVAGRFEKMNDATLSEGKTISGHSGILTKTDSLVYFGSDALASAEVEAKIGTGESAQYYETVQTAIDEIGEGDITTVQIVGDPTIPSGFCVVDGHLVHAVARVDEVEYPTVDAAITAAVAGKTVTLLTDVTLSSAVTVPVDVTLDVGSTTITGQINVRGAIAGAGIIQGLVMYDGATVIIPDEEGVLIAYQGKFEGNVKVANAAGYQKPLAYLAVSSIYVDESTGVRYAPTSVSFVDSGVETIGAPIEQYDAVHQLTLLAANTAVAKIGDVGFATLGDALEAAEADDTVTLIAASNETITIPENVTVDPSNQSFTGTIKGSGTYIIHYSNNSTAMTQPPSGVTAPEWTGTIWVIGNGADTNANDFNCTDTGKALYSHTGSKLALTGINGYFKCFNGGTVAAKEVKLFDDGSTKALVIADGAGANGFLIKKLTGTGTLADRDSGPANRGVTIEDASEFEGNIDASYKMAVKLGTSEIGSGTAKTIVVSGAVKGKNQTWTAGSGITFENSATIDITDGALITSSDVIFGSDITIKGGDAGSTVMTASGTVTGVPTVTLINQDGDEVEGDFALVKDENNQVKIVALTESIATVDGVACKSLKSAIKQAQTTGKPIVLLGDFAANGNVIPSGVAIDLDGHSLTGTFQLQSGAYILEGTGENKHVKIDGFATNFDLTFNGNTTIDYTTVGGSVGLNGTASYKANNQAISLLNRPWVDNAGSYFNANQLSLAMAGVMPESDNRIFMHIGGAKDGYYGVYLATGTNSNEVVIGWNSGNVGHTIDTMIVPNARSERHCYIITKDDETVDGVTTATFTIYLDGLKWKTFVPDEYFRISGGIQVGSCYWRIVSGYDFADGENSYVNFFRAYQRIISKAEIDAYAEAYPYTSPNGTYGREIDANGNWVAENAWTSGEETTNKPASNGNVVLTATHAEEAEATAKTITVNLDDIVEYEKLTLSGDPMIFTRANDAAKEIKSVCTVVGADVTLGEKTIDLTAGPTIVIDGGKLKFDFSRLPAVAIAAEHQGVMTEVVTGEIDQQPNGVVTVIRPTDADVKSAELAYNRNHYEIVIRNYAARIGEGETAQRFDTIADALTADQANNYANVVILNGTKVLPDGYGNYAVADDGHIVTTVNARTETKGFVSLATAAAYCEEGDVIELLADDTSSVVLNKNITIDNSTDRTVSGVISGAFSVTKTGSGNLKLTGGNTFTGALQIDEGVAEISATSSGYNLVLNGGAIKAAVVNAHSTLIKSLTLEKDSAFGSSSDKCGVVGLGTGEGGASTLNLKGHKLDIWSSNNVYFESTTVTPSAGTIHLHSGNLLTHHAPLDLTGSKIIVDSGATIEIDGADNGITVTDLEYNGNESKGGTGGIKVLGNLSGTGTIKYLTLSGAVTVSGSEIVSTTLSTTDGTSIGFADGATLATAGNYTTQGVSGNGTLIVSDGTITAKNKPSGYAVDDATVQIDGGTFTVYLGNGDPQIRNAKFVINGGELKTYGWVTMVGTIELDAASDTTIFGSSTYNPSFRGTPNIIKSGDGNVTIKAGVDTGAKFSSLTLKGGSLTLTADVVVDSLVSGVAHKTVHYDSATRTYSLVGPIATVDGVDCFTKEDLAAHPQGTLEILDTNRVTIDGDQVLVDGVALPLITIDGENVLSPAKEAAGDTGLRISEICPKLTLWDENHRDAGWLEVVNNGTAYANLKDYNIARFNRGKEVKKVTDWKCGVDVWVAPGARAVIKTSEDYPNADDKQITCYAELNNALVLGAKINPKKYPVVVLAKGKTTIQNCVVPVDVPENKSVCYDGEDLNGATVSYITTATKGTANDFTNAVAVGPQVTSLYGVADAPDPWIAFTKAQLSTDYTVTLPVNPVYGVEENEANSITKVQLIYQIGFETPVTNETAMVKGETKDAAKGWLYTGTIPGDVLTTRGQVVKFAVKITDGANNEWRSPSFNNPEDGFQWYGTIIEPTADQTDGGITTLHIFADPDEVADSPGSDHSSATALMNIDADNASYKTQKHPYGAYVGIYDNDTGMYYDSVRIDRRGNTTGKFTKKAHGLKFAKAQPFKGKDSVSGQTIECRKSSFTAEYADPAFVRQELSFKMMNDNGSPAPFHYPVRLNLNGAFYQLAFHTERFSDELIEDFYGLDGKGYGYKNIGSFNPGLTPVSGGIEKKTPDDGITSDNGVLDAFCRKMEDVELISEGHTQGVTDADITPDSAFETEFSRTLTKVVTTDFDLPAWLNYIALTKITGETDDVWANLSGYYDINGTGTWMPLVYDTNQSFGQWHKSDDPNMATEMANAGKNCANYDHFKAHPLYGGHHIMVHYSGGAPYSAANNGSTARKPYKGNRCFEAIFQNAKYRRLYLRRLRTLMDAEFGGASADKAGTPMYQRAKEMVARYSKVAAKDREIWTNYETSAQELWVFGHEEDGWTAEEGLEWMWTNYIEPRRTHLYVTHAAEGHEGQIGYGETLCAGIPEAQSSIDTLKGKFAVEWDGAHQAVVLKNKNAEAVDVSGWAVAGRIAFVFPAGTVIDQGTEANPGLLYITADRKATVASFGSDINDQTIIGNGTANADVDAIVVRTNTGLRILGEATDQETSIRFESIYGNTTGDGDTGEWFTLKNIGSVADVNLEGMTICILKDDAKSTEADNHCHVNFTSKSKPGSLSSGDSKKFEQSKFVDYGFGKIQNNKLIIKLYDKYGINYQTLAVTQKDYPIAYGKGAYLVADSTEVSVAKGEWHQVYDAAVQGDLTLKDWTKDKDSFKAMSKDLTVLVNDKVTIDLQNPTFGDKASLKLNDTGVATIKGTATKTNGTGTVINSEGSLVFEDGIYTFTTENDCIQAEGDITINGGTFICHSTGNDGIDSNQNIVINGGTIFAFTAATETDGNKSTGLDVNSGKSITINGGTVIATSLSKAALEAMTINGQTTKIVEVEGVSSATKAIGDVIVTFPTMEVSPTAVLVSTPTMTEETEVTSDDPDTVEIIAADVEAETPAVNAIVPPAWVADKEGDVKVAAAEAYVLGLAAPTEKPVVSSEQTAEPDSIRIVDNVEPRHGTGVTVKRTLFVGTTPGAEAADESIEETNGGFTVPLPTEGAKVKYLKIKYTFE